MSKLQLRFIGAGIVVFNLWLIGTYGITGFGSLMLTVGFVTMWEYLVVKHVPTTDEASKFETIALELRSLQSVHAGQARAIRVTVAALCGVLARAPSAKEYFIQTLAAQSEAVSKNVPDDEREHFIRTQQAFINAANGNQ